MTKELSVLLVDDQTLFVNSLRRVIEISAPDIELVGIAYDGASALRLVREQRPTLVLMDVRMPTMDGVECTRRIREEFPDIKVLILTTFDHDEYVKGAVQHGAVGYLLKSIPPEQLIECIRATQHAPFIVSPDLAERKLFRHDSVNEDIAGEPGLSEKKLSTLTNREREILRLMADEYSNQEIADQLYLAEQTVRNHITAIYAKVGIHDRWQLVRACRTVPRLVAPHDY